jgi:hypothetical protein
MPPVDLRAAGPAVLLAPSDSGQRRACCRASSVHSCTALFLAEVRECDPLPVLNGCSQGRALPEFWHKPRALLARLCPDHPHMTWHDMDDMTSSLYLCSDTKAKAANNEVPV